MENTTIQPWDTEENVHEFYIPQYIEKMAHDVLQKYDLHVKTMEVVTTKSDKGGAIWKLETDKGPKSLKLLHRRPSRSLFSLGAQEYLVDVQKAKVPPIVKTINGENFVEAGGKLWFVAEWIESLFPVSKDLEGAKKLCFALGEFHHLSKGFTPPPQAEVASRLDKWPQSFDKVLRKMDWFRNIAHAYHDMPASPYLLEVIETFEEQAKESIRKLQESSYFELMKKGNAYWGLVHQDYGWSNGQMGADGMWIIDLDGVAFDLPIRDLRKLISGTMADLFHWDANWVMEMIQAYHEANPISPKLYDLLMIDLSMPNEFYKNIKEVIFEPELFLTEPTIQLIQTIVSTDESKWPVLEQIRGEWKGME
ncbi:CotS family spore coat protein [Heyndrickxia acidicola]|uniref:CotS family spore coat protein n=1 Tax=Heyndrickxia acidicola TaxID=209389 RepID=A0ABU6MMM8_9BACI|nr:CotS family spore coat protein [Heyndrickxia acidicola]MED1205775.1 CotS family spore coat protein [Heyndrickxia acidicola]